MPLNHAQPEAVLLLFPSDESVRMGGRKEDQVHEVINDLHKPFRHLGNWS